MEVTIPGRGIVRLTNQHFKARGGEGDIYAKGDLIFKIYIDPNRVPPAAKLRELAVLQHPQIIIPQSPIFDHSQRLVGFTMQYVRDTEPLCKLFTKAFRQREKITPKDSVGLARQLQEIVSFIHRHRVLVVDLNELNFLLRKNELFAIDTNSYQTPNFPATAIMPHIADPHCGGKFNEQTDWFSFGIVSFQMLIGIHPYKGNHPDFDGIPKDQQLLERMRRNVSVLNRRTAVPSICQPFNVIPNGLLGWYKAIFDGGKRLAPPADYDGTIIITPLPPRSSPILGQFVVQKLFSHDAEVIDAAFASGQRIVRTVKSVFLNDRKICDSGGKAAFLQTATEMFPCLISNCPLSVMDLRTKTAQEINLRADDILVSEHRLYIRQGTHIVQLSLHQVNNRVIVGNRVVGRVLDSTESVQAFTGLIVQNLLGRYYLSLLENDKCFQLGVPELDGYKVIDAQRSANVVALVASKSGAYDRFLFVLTENYSGYTIRKTTDVSYLDANVCSLPNGLIIIMGDDDKLEISSAKTARVNLVDAGQVAGKRLYSDDMTMMFSASDTLFRFSMIKTNV